MNRSSSRSIENRTEALDTIASVLPKWVSGKRGFPAQAGFFSSFIAREIWQQQLLKPLSETVSKARTSG